MIRKKDLLGEFEKTPFPIEIQKQYEYYGYSAVKKINGEDVLCHTIANHAGIKALVFCYGTDKYISYLPQQKKWSNAGIDRLAFSYCGSHEKDSDCTPDSRKTAADFFGFENERWSSYSYISKFQQKKMNERAEKARKKKQDWLDLEMSPYSSPIPEDFEEFTWNVTMKNGYPIVFDKANDYCKCSRCGNTFSISKNKLKPMQGKNLECPECGGIGKAKSINRQTTMDLNKWTLFVQTDGDNVLLRYFRNNETFYKGRYDESHESRKMSEVYRTTISSNDVKAFMSEGNKWVKYRQRWCSWNTPSEWYFPTKGIYIYKDCLKSIEKLDAYKYSGISQLVNGFSPDSMMVENYLPYYINHNFVEKLAKCGLYNLVSYAINRNSYYTRDTVFNEKGGTLKEILQLNGEQMNLLKEYENPDAYIIIEMRNFSEYPNKIVRRILNSHGLTKFSRQLKELLRETGPEKTLNYLEGKSEEDMRLFFDTQDLRRQLNYPTQYIFPKNVKITHDMFIRELNERREKKRQIEEAEQNEKMAVLVKEMMENPAYAFTDGEYSIIIPKDREMYNNESKVLNHCVRTYFTRVLEKSTHIFFIRRTEDMETPFFTLELDKEFNIVQCHTRNNLKSTIYDEKNNTQVTRFAEKYSRRLKRTVNAA